MLQQGDSTESVCGLRLSCDHERAPNNESENATNTYQKSQYMNNEFKLINSLLL